MTGKNEIKEVTFPITYLENPEELENLKVRKNFFRCNW